MTAALEGVEGLLLDLSGVIYVEDQAVPGAAEALASLRGRGMPLRLVTNTTMRPRRSILERLERLGLEADPAELITPATLAASRCEEAGYDSVALVVLDELREDLEGLEERGDPVDAVIVGDLGDRWDFEVLNRAFRQLMDGAALIALQRNRYWETADGLSLDAGPFVAALEYATGPHPRSSSSRSASSVCPSSGWRWSAMTWRLTSAARSMPGSPGSSSAPASTARTWSVPRASSRPRPWTRSPTCRPCSAERRRAIVCIVTTGH
jgi:haloacid dehalogenase-like hydrolase